MAHREEVNWALWSDVMTAGTPNLHSAHPALKQSIHARVSFETSFDLKQPKLEPKPVLARSKTKRLFRFYTETESFVVSIEPVHKI